MSKKLLTFCFLFLMTASAWANTRTIPNDPATSLMETTYLPVGLHSTNTKYGGCFSISQQLYFASELSGASSKNITAITFYCSSGVSLNRKLRVWMNNTAITAFPTSPTTPNFVAPGTQVFTSKKAGVDNGVAITPGESYTITFDTPFAWDGTSNIIVTVFDSTGVKASSSTKHHMIQTTGVARFLHKTYWYDSYAGASWTMTNLTAATAESINDRGYVDKITFTFEGAASAPATPSGLTASNVGVSTASLAWSAVSDATSYKLYYSTSAEGIYAELASPNTNSYDWSGLTASTTYFVKVAAVNGAGSSALSDPISFTTLVPHIHDGISFEPWFNPSTLPTSGNYYISSNMNFDAYANDVITLTGDLNLCLNGKTVNMEASRFVVPSGKTLTIYDNVGGGKLTSFVASEVGAFEELVTAFIVVKSGGELELKEGTIENTYVPDADGESYAIYSNGTLRLSGDVLINSNSADIYLYSSNIITLDGTISNAPKHTVYKSGGAFTSGWSTHMSGEDPRDYFESANSARSVCLNEGEASLRKLLRLSENSNNSAISDNRDVVIDVALTRSLTSSQYNTFCLPFNLNNAQLEAIFGVGYDLEEFDHSNFDGETLELIFEKRTELVEGAPYLIKPSIDVVNPFFEGVTIHDGNPGQDNWDDNIFVYSTFAPTALDNGNENVLFLGANNELFWPSSTSGNIKGFRAYFEVKGDARKTAKRARIGKQTDDATAIENQMENGKCENVKMIKDGLIIILRDGKTYNVLGQQIK